MNDIKQQNINTFQTLKILERTLSFYSKAETLSADFFLQMAKLNLIATREEFLLVLQDSLIWRFKQSVGFFLEFLETYLEAVEKFHLDIKSPRTIVRTLAQAQLIKEQEAEEALKMVASRNKTFYTYKEEIDEQIRKDIIKYHDLMEKIMQRIKV